MFEEFPPAREDRKPESQEEEEKAQQPERKVDEGGIDCKMKQNKQFQVYKQVQNR